MLAKLFNITVWSRF